MDILFIGDVVGSPGRKMVQHYLPKLKKYYEPTMTILNGENAAGGRGITAKIAKSFFEAGVQVITLGNHTWDQKGTDEFLDEAQRVIRPANFPPDVPGKGYTVVNINQIKVAVINLQGRTFMPPLDCPFQKAEEILRHVRADVIIVDFHAEATSEKQALGWFLDGKVAAVLGTHTHVQTADERILPQQTAYITDVGMTGPRDGILGMKKEAVLYRFMTSMPARFEVDENARAQFNAVLLSVNPKTGTALQIKRITFDEEAPLAFE